MMTDHLDAGANEPPERMLARLDRMVATGRVTDAEAERVRSARSDAERDAALDAIRLRHIRERVARTVAEGQVAPEEANRILAELERSEDPRELRRLLRRNESS